MEKVLGERRRKHLAEREAHSDLDAEVCISCILPMKFFTLILIAQGVPSARVLLSRLLNVSSAVGEQ